jgi:hypothetical protein
MITVRHAKGRAMAQAVSRRPLTAEARVRSRVSPCGICGGQSGTGTGFSPSTLVFLVNFIPPMLHAPLQGRRKKQIIFITRLHNKPHSCAASVASAAGSLKKRRKPCFPICSPALRSEILNLVFVLRSLIRYQSLTVLDRTTSPVIWYSTCASHGSLCSDDDLLGCNAVFRGITKLRRNMLPPSSWSK